MADSPEISQKRETPKTMTRRNFLGRIVISGVKVVAAKPVVKVLESIGLATATTGCVQNQIDAYVKGQTQTAEETARVTTPSPTDEESAHLAAVVKTIEAIPGAEKAAEEERKALELAIYDGIEERGLRLRCFATRLVEFVGGIPSVDYPLGFEIMATDGVFIKNFPDSLNDDTLKDGGPKVGVANFGAYIPGGIFLLKLYNEVSQREERWIVIRSWVPEILEKQGVIMEDQKTPFIVGEKRYYFFAIKDGGSKLAKQTKNESD